MLYDRYVTLNTAVFLPVLKAVVLLLGDQGCDCTKKQAKYAAHWKEGQCHELMTAQASSNDKHEATPVQLPL